MEMEKHSLGLKGKLIRYLWSQLKGYCDFVNKFLVRTQKIHTVIITKFQTNV